MLMWAYFFLGLALKPVQVGEKMQMKQLNRNQFYTLSSNDTFQLKKSFQISKSIQHFVSNIT